MLWHLSCQSNLHKFLAFLVEVVHLQLLYKTLNLVLLYCYVDQQSPSSNLDINCIKTEGQPIDLEQFREPFDFVRGRHETQHSAVYRDMVAETSPSCFIRDVTNL